MVSGTVGRVRIGVGHIVADPVRDALFPKLLLDRPAAKLDFYVGVNVDLFERVSNGSLDFAVCGVANGVPDGLESTVLVRSAMVAVVRVGHPLSHLEQPTLEMLQKFRYASASGMLPGDPLADKRIREFGGQHLDQAFTTNSMNTLLEVVAKTDLVAITTWNPSVQRRWGGQLLPIDIQGGMIKSVVGSVFRRGRYLSPLAQYALFLVEEALGAPETATPVPLKPSAK
jgi:DNA-binding transcriptional LysR family regulator